MIRRLVNFLATVSLLLAFTAVVFWVRSYYHAEAVCYGDPDKSDFYQLGSWRGLVIGQWIDLPLTLRVEYQRGLWAYSLEGTAYGIAGLHNPTTATTVPWRSVGPVIVIDGPCSLPDRPGSDLFLRPIKTKGVAIPFWTVSGLLFLLPIARFASAAQSRRRQMKGLCSKCGYDLRESPDRCPECGLEVR